MKTRQRPHLQHPQSLESTYLPKTKTNKHKYKRPRGIQDTPTASPRHKNSTRAPHPASRPHLPTPHQPSAPPPHQQVICKTTSTNIARRQRASSSTAKPCHRSLNVAIQTWLRLAASKRRRTMVTVSVDLIREKKRLTLTS